MVVDARENGNKEHASVSNMLWCLWLWAVAILEGAGVGNFVSRNQASSEAKCKFADFLCCQFLCLFSLLKLWIMSRNTR